MPAEEDPPGPGTQEPADAGEASGEAASGEGTAGEGTAGEGTAGEAGTGDAFAGGASADAVRGALGRARAAAAARGLTPAARTRGGGFEAPRTASDRAAERARRRGASARSGAWPDARDPQLLGPVVERLVGERGWQEPVSVGGVFGRWEAIVGPEVGSHCRPEAFEEGKLVVRAESTAWATQVRLLVPTVLRRLDEELGSGVVTSVVVRGPQSPSWRKGGRSAPGGRGPRDTYG